MIRWVSRTVRTSACEVPLSECGTPDTTAATPNRTGEKITAARSSTSLRWIDIFLVPVAAIVVIGRSYPKTLVFDGEAHNAHSKNRCHTGVTHTGATFSR